MGQLGPHPYFSTFGVMMAWGFLLLGIVAVSLLGVEVDVGGTGQSFLNSNRFPDFDPASGHGVPAWVGIFLSGGGLLFEELPWEGLPFSKFIVVLGAVVDIHVIIFLALGVDSGLDTTCTLYLFVGMSLLLLSVAFAFLLTRGWAVLD